MVTPVGSFRARVGKQSLDLPLMEIDEGVAIALLITVDQGVSFAERAGRELAELLEPAHPEVIASVATQGIPIAIEISRALGIDDYLILQKTPKIHLADAVDEPLKSITTGSSQRLLFDRERIGAVQGRRVALVDDVVSTGGSLRAAVALLRRVGAEPVAIGTLVTEAGPWREALGDDANLVQSLGVLPLFRRGEDGIYREDWGSDSTPQVP
ncbi:MAG TPA: phosphoribosyltransferase family protein [Acidimicrobiales bacterium]|nr:phosphoribosyltransferase family protein [Acidimicrobiales bacterium]